MAWFDELNLPGATIDGFFGYVTADGPDADDNPDVILADGTVTFTATTPAARVDGAWLGIQSVTARIFEGRLIVSEENPQPVRILATDANVGVEDWAWRATFNVPGFKLDPLTFRAPSDTTVNLTADLIPIKSAPYQIVEGASVVDAEADAAGRFRFELSDGSFTNWVAVPVGPIATQAAADYVDENAVIQHGIMPDGTNVDTLISGTARGVHYIATAASAETMTGLPAGYAGAGPFTVIGGPSGYGIAAQEYRPRLSATEAAVLVRMRTGTDTWTDWTRIDEAPAPDLENVVRTHGVFSEGDDVDLLQSGDARGEWYVPTGAVAETMNGLPDGYRFPGPLKVMAGPQGYGYTTQTFYPRLSATEFAILHRQRTGTGAWSAWKRVDAAPDTGSAVLMRGLIPEGANVDEYTAGDSRGEWYIPTTAIAQTIVGLPAEFIGPGPFKVLAGPPGYAYTAQEYWPRLSSSEGAHLTRNRTGVGTWSAWKRVDAPSGGGAGDPFEPVAVGMRNADLLDLMVQRKGGTIGTGGKAAFALRLDHGTTAFRDHLGPMLKQYGLPATMAVYSKQNEVNAANHDVPWSQVQSWHHSHGMSFGNHSDDHLDKPDAEGWHGGTVGSLDELKALMPNVPVEQYIPHGSVGYDRYGGFNRANSHEAIVGTLAGRMALSSHALIAGYRGDRYRPMKGRPMQGETHWSMEEATVNTFKFMIDAAINRRQGLAVMFHPEFIGLNGKMTWAMVEECLAYVAQKRDEGLIIPLTLDGLAVADVRNDWRDDLIDPPQAMMQDPATIYGNFTETPGAFTSSTPGQYVRHAPSLANRGWAYGGTRTAQWHVSSTNGATVTLRVQEGTDTPPWASTRTVTVPAGESIQYLPFGLPLTLSVQSLRLELTLDSGDITIHECHAYAA